MNWSRGQVSYLDNRWRYTVLAGTLGQEPCEDNILKVLQDVKIVEKMFQRIIIFAITEFCEI